MTTAIPCHASLRVGTGSGCTDSVGNGHSPVLHAVQDPKIGCWLTWERNVQARRQACKHKTGGPKQKEDGCSDLRRHQVTPESSTATGQLTPGSDLCEMRWGKNIGDPYFCLGEALQLGARMLDYLSQTSKAVYHPGAPLREASGVTFHRFCSIVATFYRLFKIACSLAFTLFTSILLA